MTDPILERILKKLQENGQTARELERRLDLANGSITRWKKKGGKSYVKHIVDIAIFLRTTPGYLLNGENIKSEEMTADESDLLKNYRLLDRETQTYINGIVRKLAATDEDGINNNML